MKQIAILLGAVLIAVGVLTPAQKSETITGSTKRANSKEDGKIEENTSDNGSGGDSGNNSGSQSGQTQLNSNDLDS